MNYIQCRILKLVKQQKPLENALEQGFSLFELVENLVCLQQSGYLLYKQDHYVITENGKNALENEVYVKIRPLKKYKIEKPNKLSLDNIYVPNYIKER